MKRTIYNKLAFGTCLGLIVLATLAYGAVHQAVLAITYFLVAVIVLLWALDCRREGAIKLSASLIQAPILAAAVYGLLQILPLGELPAEAGVAGIPRTISIEPFVTIISAVHFLAISVFLAALLIYVDSAERIRKIIVFVSVFGFAYAFFAVLQSVLSPDKIYGIYGRPGANVFGSFVNRNHFAAWMEMAIALPLGLLFSGVVPKDKRLLFGTAGALMGASIVASGSRGGSVAFVVEVLVLSLLTYGSGRGRLGVRIALAAGLLAVVIGGALFVGGETSLSRIADSQTAVGTDQDRSRIWSASVKIIEYGMPLGVGLGAFGTAYSQFDASSGLERVEQAHNDYLQVLTDAGLPGAVIGLGFLMIVGFHGRAVLSSKNDFRRAVGVGALAGVVGVLVHSIFDFVLHTTAVSLMFLLLLSVLTATAADRFPDEVPNESSSHKKRRRRTEPVED